MVSDWDDPRLFTLPALRRRGVPPEAIVEFMGALVPTGACSTLDRMALDCVVRNYLYVTSPRIMVVLEPLKITIANYDELDVPRFVDTLHFPSNPKCKQTFRVSLSKSVYIEKSDYREKADKWYRSLTSTQPVGLLHTGLVLHFQSSVLDEKGEPTEIVVNAVKEADFNPNPKAFIHWVAQSAADSKVCLYKQLFKQKDPEDPAKVPDAFVTDCNPDSLVVLNAKIDRGLANVMKPCDRFQFERVGYFCLDLSADADKLVFNQTVSLYKHRHTRLSVDVLTDVFAAIPSKEIKNVCLSSRLASILLEERAEVLKQQTAYEFERVMAANGPVFKKLLRAQYVDEQFGTSVTAFFVRQLGIRDVGKIYSDFRWKKLTAKTIRTLKHELPDFQPD